MDTLLYVENLTVSFDGFLALRNLNLIVERDERVRLLIGPNGAGKTTLFDALTGHVTPSAGRALFRDTVNVIGMSPHAIANAGVIRRCAPARSSWLSWSARPAPSCSSITTWSSFGRSRDGATA